METENLYPINVHHGRTIKRLRISKGLRQQELGPEVGLSHQSISDYEKKRVIEDAILSRFAKYFNVSLEDLKEMEEDKPSVFIENNVTFENATNTSIGDYIEENNTTTNNNPIEKITELYEDKIVLLNSLLKEEKEKVKLLEKELRELKQKSIN